MLESGFAVAAARTSTAGAHHAEICHRARDSRRRQIDPQTNSRPSRRSPAAFSRSLVHRCSGLKVSSPTTRSTASTSHRMKRWSANTPAREVFRPIESPPSGPSSVPPPRKVELCPLCPIHASRPSASSTPAWAVSPYCVRLSIAFPTPATSTSATRRAFLTDRSQRPRWRITQLERCAICRIRERSCW